MLLDTVFTLFYHFLNELDRDITYPINCGNNYCNIENDQQYIAIIIGKGVRVHDLPGCKKPKVDC